MHNLPRGGARRRLAEQLRHFRGPVVEICLETATPITANAVVIPLRRRAPARRPAIRPPFRYLDMVTLEAAWRRAAARIRASGADVVYLNPCRFLQAPPIFGRPVPPTVYFCDEARRVDVELVGKRSRNPLTLPLYKPIYDRERSLDRATTARVDVLATNSQYSASEIERAYARRPVVIRMGVAEALLHSSKPETRQNFVLSVGTLIPGKGHDLVIRAAAGCAARPSVQIVAPRPAPDEEKRLRDLAAEIGVTLEVEVGISDEALATLYGSAMATAYLAVNEPFGLVSIEAQACGCPMIVSAEGGLPETIVEGVTGWSTPREPRAVSGLLDRLADPAISAEMSRAASAHGATWTWEASASQVEGLLTSCTSRREA